MYIPPPFRETRPEVLHALIRQYSFGTLVSLREGELFASHLPFLFDSDRGAHGTLVGHMARANPQWQSFAESPEVLVLFQGPHAYISPTWYETELSVPTWNYAVVHAYGTPRLVEDGEALHGILERLVPFYEAGFAEPWALDRLPSEFVAKMMQSIVGFEIPLARLEGKLKLSQNRSRADRQGVVNGLEKDGRPESQALADLMRSLTADE